MTNAMQIIPPLMVGSRICLFGDSIGHVTHILFDYEGEPAYYTNEGKRVTHFEVETKSVSQGRRAWRPTGTRFFGA